MCLTSVNYYKRQQTSSNGEFKVHFMKYEITEKKTVNICIEIQKKNFYWKFHQIDIFINEAIRTFSVTRVVCVLVLGFLTIKPNKKKIEFFFGTSFISRFSCFVSFVTFSKKDFNVLTTHKYGQWPCVYFFGLWII